MIPRDEVLGDGFEVWSMNPCGQTGLALGYRQRTGEVNL